MRRNICVVIFFTILLSVFLGGTTYAASKRLTVRLYDKHNSEISGMEYTIIFGILQEGNEMRKMVRQRAFFKEHLIDINVKRRIPYSFWVEEVKEGLQGKFVRFDSEIKRDSQYGCSCYVITILE